MSLETKCLLKAFQLHYCPDNDAKSMVKHLIFLRKFAVITDFVIEKKVKVIKVIKVSKVI